MIYLIGEMLLLLLIAAAIGFAAAWVLRGLGQSRAMGEAAAALWSQRLSAAEAEYEAKSLAAEAANARLKADLHAAQTRVGTLENDGGKRVAGCPDHPDAEAALTRYRTLAANDQAALLELNPQTGRMHQIRVHLASIDRPIAGDVRYGGALMVGGAPAPRLMLHAAALTFPHPGGGMKRIEAAVPEDMQALIETIGLAKRNSGAGLAVSGS